MAEDNVFIAKTVDEAIADGLEALGITLDEAEITVIEEGRKRLFGSVKAKVKVEKRQSDGEKAVVFIDGLLEILNVTAKSEVVSEDDNIVIDIKTENSAKIIGKHGDVLDAIQCLAGAVANTGKEEYKKVVVDCQNYHAQREETLKSLARKMAKKAVEKGRKLILEPMTPYERRIIHSELSQNTEVKTISEGKEPYRYIAVIPNNAKPGDKGLRFGERKERNGRSEKRGNGNGRERCGDRRGDRRERKPSSGAKRSGKKEIFFGTFLGNSGAGKNEE